MPAARGGEDSGERRTGETWRDLHRDSGQRPARGKIITSRSGRYAKPLSSCTVRYIVIEMKAVLDHVGIAVRDLPAALAFYREALGLEVEAAEEVASQRVRAHFVPVGESSLELLEATAPDSPIAKYLDARGPGLHHITLRVDDIHAALAQLEARGAKLIDPRPRPGAEGSLVAFIHPSSAHGVLVELKQLPASSSQLSAPPSHPPVVSGFSRTSAISRHTIGDL